MMTQDFTWEQKAHQLAELLRGTLKRLEHVQGIALSNKCLAVKYHDRAERLSKKLAKLHKLNNLK